MEKVAEKNDTPFICPDIYESHGEDMEFGRPFGRYLHEELPVLMANYFFQNRSLQYLYQDNQAFIKWAQSSL